MTLKGRKVVLGVCGGIAAYKSAYLVRLLQGEECKVQVVMTTNGTRFITPLTLATLSGRPVYTTMWPSEDALQQADIAHIELAEWAEVMVVAPATANCLAKLSCGLADDLLSTALITVTCPVLLCPAMNMNMYNNPIVQENISFLRDKGYEVMEPGAGQLACKDIGPGRMPEPEEILEEIDRLLG